MCSKQFKSFKPFNRFAPFKPFNKANVPIIPKVPSRGFVTAGSIVQAVYESKRSISLKLMSI
jgi:hypothetical protein